MAKAFNWIIGIIFCFFLYGYVCTVIPYQLCQLEHDNLFVADVDSWVQSLQSFGGLGEWLSDFAIQFFALPHGGSLVFVFPVLALFPVTAFFLHKFRVSAAYYPVAMLPAVVQLFSQYDFNYYWNGSLCLFIALLLLASVSALPLSSRKRFVVFLMGIPVVACLFGAIALPYTLCGILLFAERKDWPYRLLLPLGLWLLTVLCCHYTLYADTWGQAFSPALYYNPYIEMPAFHWASWLLLPFLLLLASWSRLHIPVRKKILSGGCCVCLWMVVFGLHFHYAPSFINQKNQGIWQLNHYSFVEDWDGIIRFCSAKPVTNQLYMNYVNMALAQKGELGNKAFLFRPYGTAALMVKGNGTGAVHMLMSDVQYTVGCIARAQQHAFEAQVSLPHSCGIQTLMRLVKTNLILGHYAVADKYLTRIAGTLFYKDWADKYRRFLYDDAAVEADKELGGKRRSLSHTNRFAMSGGWELDLEDIIEANPQNHIAVTYLGLSYLLSKNVEGFHRFLDRYYGTDCLKQLPLSFQQGVIVVFQQEKEVWGKYNLSPDVTGLYHQYRDIYIQNRNNPNLKNILAKSFGNTFWYYLMFI